MARAIFTSLALITLTGWGTASVDATRLRTLHPTGAVLHAEHLQANRVAISLWARATPETPTRHGYRHLLEHLVVRGDGTADRRLEAVGGFMRAATLREATHVQVVVPPEAWQLGIEVLGELLRPFATTPEAIARELPILRHELALRDADDILPALAWERGLGRPVLDPMGTIVAIEGATPQDLTELHALHFAAPNLVLAIAGPIDLDAATQALAKVIDRAPTGPRLRPLDPGQPVPDGGGERRVETSAVVGEARAALVPGVRGAQTLWTLAAALALASDIGNCFVSYTPSLGSGIVTLGRAEETSGIGIRIDSLAARDEAALYRAGYELGQTWIDRQMRTPESSTHLRGILLLLDPTLEPEQLQRTMRAMTFEDFRIGLSAFSRERAVIVVGVGR